jgi:hypothetical protein
MTLINESTLMYVCSVLTVNCIIQNVPFKTTLSITHECFYTQSDKTSGSIEFFHPYAVVAADALFEIGMAIISALLSFIEHLLQINTSSVPEFCY